MVFSKFLKYFLVLFVFSCSYLAKSAEVDEPHIHIDENEFKGSIVGKRYRNSNVEYFEFRGIPYAKPPIREMRFRDPQKLDNFVGTLDATRDGFECPSITARNASEACLNLNVYTKQLNSSTLLPVLVLIHPGGLYLGSGASYFMNPSHMMTQDLVVVTFNYRLGSLGFLNLGTAEVPGNAGLKDQVFALRWVQKYINYFGGNPKDVTLMGYSAGALSVQLHLMSDMSKNLFNKAIIMSGSLPPQIYLPRQQKYLAVRLAKRLDCKNFQSVEEEIPYGAEQKYSDYEDIKNEEILKCLNQFSGLEIGNKLRSIFDFPKDNPIFLWLPVIEKHFKHELFLSENVIVAHKNVLLGYTNGELCASAKDILTVEAARRKFGNEFKVLAPRIFMYERHPKKDEITEKIKRKYFNGSTDFPSKDYDAICDLFSDSIIRFGAHKLADQLFKKEGIVYFYEFSFVDENEKEDNGFPQKEDRCEHMSDLQYLFNWSGHKHDSERQKRIVQMYTSFIYDFVKNGQLSDVKAKSYPHSYAAIDETIEYKEGRNFKNYEFWQEIFPEYFNYELKI